jgi:hypothetical protein
MRAMDILALVNAVIMGLLGIYFLLGLFSSAPWLHTDGRRKDGQWLVIPMARSVRWFLFFVVSYSALRDFTEAFHKDFSAYYLPIDGIVGIGFIYFFLIGRKRKSNGSAP